MQNDPTIPAGMKPWHGGERAREVAQAIGAEIDRQCGIGAGTCGTLDDGSGLFEVHASLDLRGFAAAMLAFARETSTNAARCGASPDHADILETIENAADDWQKQGYTSALAEVRDMANVGRALMEALPKGYSYMNCPSEIVSDLQNERDEALAASPNAASAAWDHRYRPLVSGEIIAATDECRRDDGSWATGICVGQTAPDPAYTSHRIYRRLKVDPNAAVEREAIARIIDPSTCWDASSPLYGASDFVSRRDAALAKADRILALTTAGHDVRASAVRELCAMTLEDLAESEDRANRHAETPEDRGRCAVIAAEFRRAAKAVRATPINGRELLAAALAQAGGKA